MMTIWKKMHVEDFMIDNEDEDEEVVRRYLSGHAEEYLNREEPFAHQEEDLNDTFATRLVDEPGDGEREYHDVINDSHEDDMEPMYVF